MAFHEFRGETTKKDLYHKICEKTVLAQEFWSYNQYLGSLRPRTALQWHRGCYFLWGTILAWVMGGGHNSRLGGHKQWFGRVWPRNAPRGVGPAASLQQFIELIYRIFVKEILLENEEKRTIWGNRELPQTFFHDFLYLRKYDLIRLTPYHCQPCIRNFVTLQKA